MTTPATTVGSTAEVLATLKTAIADMRACLRGPTADDTIEAWSNGLAVIRHADGTAGICTLEDAPAWDGKRKPRVCNGNGHAAALYRRSALLIAEIEKLEPLIAVFEAGL